MNIISSIKDPKVYNFQTTHDKTNIILFSFPLIPAISIFLGSWLTGWNPGIESSAVSIPFSSALLLASIVYLSVLSFIFIMSSFCSWLSKKILINRTFEESLSYCTYLSIPFLVLSIAFIIPNRWLSLIAFSIAGLWSLFLMKSTLNDYFNKDRGKKVNTNDYIFFIGTMGLFFFIALGAGLAAFLVFWSDILQLVSNYQR